MATDNISRCTPYIVDDALEGINGAIQLTDSRGIIKPFRHIYRSVYQSTMRIMGAHEIADCPQLCTETLSMFEKLAEGYSPSRMVFPWLPTPAHIMRMKASANLYKTFLGNVRGRKNTKTQGNDPLKPLLHSGKATPDIAVVRTWTNLHVRR